LLHLKHILHKIVFNRLPFNSLTAHIIISFSISNKLPYFKSLSLWIWIRQYQPFSYIVITLCGVPSHVKLQQSQSIICLFVNINVAAPMHTM